MQSDLCRRFAGHQRSNGCNNRTRNREEKKTWRRITRPYSDQREGITTIAFNRPEKRNAMGPQLHNEMFELLTELRYNSAGTVGILGRA